MWKIDNIHILQILQITFLGANFWNIARMHNSTDYVNFLEKSLSAVFEKVPKTSFWQKKWPKNEVFDTFLKNGATDFSKNVT